jgi:hypothetical protein
MSSSVFNKHKEIKPLSIFLSAICSERGLFFFLNYSVVQRLLNQDGACQLNQDIFAYYIGDYDDNSYSFVEMEETVRAYIIMH